MIVASIVLSASTVDAAAICSAKFVTGASFSERLERLVGVVVAPAADDGRRPRRAAQRSAEEQESFDWRYGWRSALRLVEMTFPSTIRFPLIFTASC